jgi:hypothetical protein
VRNVGYKAVRPSRAGKGAAGGDDAVDLPSDGDLDIENDTATPSFAPADRTAF